MTKRFVLIADGFIPSVETFILVPLLVNTTRWFVVNEWLLILILLDGISLFTVIFPKTNEVLYPTPLIVETPIDSLGLKNTLLLVEDSNLSTDLSIVKKSGKKETAAPTVCATAADPLSILKIFSFLNTPRTLRVSVPILMLLPTDIWSGIGAT